MAVPAMGSSPSCCSHAMPDPSPQKMTSPSLWPAAEVLPKHHAGSSLHFFSWHEAFPPPCSALDHPLPFSTLPGLFTMLHSPPNSSQSPFRGWGDSAQRLHELLLSDLEYITGLTLVPLY